MSGPNDAQTYALVSAALLWACTSSPPVAESIAAAGDASTGGVGVEDSSSMGGSAANADVAHAGGGAAAVGGSPNTGGSAGLADGANAEGACTRRGNGGSDAGVGGASTGGAQTGGAANVEGGARVEAGAHVEGGADVGVGGAPIVLECLGGGYSCDAGEVTNWRLGAVVPDGKGDPCKTVVYQCPTCCITESNGRADPFVTDPKSLCRP